jgi:hypothetical protein
MAPSGNACAAMSGAPLVCDISRCDLCNQYAATHDMNLFLVRNKILIATSDREWEGKAGVRHLCSLCSDMVKRSV